MKNPDLQKVPLMTISFAKITRMIRKEIAIPVNA